ncbi:MAG: hypothetical protein WDO68_02610 [Gammaproteobacteria bacterium]
MRKRLKPTYQDMIWGLLLGLLVLCVSVVHSAFTVSASTEERAESR